MMSNTLISRETPCVQLQDHLVYPEAGVLSKLIWKSEVCQYSLFCLAANTEISEHTATRHATVHVIEGTGVLTLEGQEIPLSPGIFIFMEANAPHSLMATSNLAFVLTLSSVSQS
ncbi:quercetin dioxygenase-like cupin family protein [Thermostichus sp. MS-CIW-40]|jgi:quercetin dioxygenase-like cupin family protein